MQQQEIFKRLQEMDVKLSEVEEALKMPKNYLSRFKNPQNILPLKWEKPLLDYIKKSINGTSLNDYLKTDNQHEKLEQKASTSVTVKTKLVVEEDGLKEKPSDEKLAALEIACDKINKDYGAGSIMNMNKVLKGIEVISTGSFGLDLALGVGGLPKGRIVEIYGPESAGKTTLAIHIIAEAQKDGGKCVYIDAEHSFDPEYAKKLGVNISNLKISQPMYGEEGLEIADRTIASGGVSVIVIDSVAALVPKAELEGEMGDSRMGLHARLMSQACRKLTGTISRTGTICIFINQLRTKIGLVMGNPEVTTGGNALKFYASVRLDIRKCAIIKDGDVLLGNRTKVKVVKNKCAAPYKICEFDILLNQGIDFVGEIVEMAAGQNIIKKSGSWYSYKEAKLAQGKEQTKQILKDNPEMFEEIKQQIKTDYSVNEEYEN